MLQRLLNQFRVALGFVPLSSPTFLLDVGYSFKRVLEEASCEGLTFQVMSDPARSLFHATVRKDGQAAAYFDASPTGYRYVSHFFHGGWGRKWPTGPDGHINWAIFRSDLAHDVEGTIERCNISPT